MYKKAKKKRKNIIKKKYSKKSSTTLHEISHNEFQLTENNRVTYTYKISEYKEVVEVTCVSLDIRIVDKWETIIYYDSFHDGILHRHKKIAFGFDQDIIDSDHVKRRGTQKTLLQWAIQDLKHNYEYYKKVFVKRNETLLKGYEVNVY